MATKDLITLARAKQAILAITNSSYDTLLQTLITAASDAIEKYCRRDFYSRSYDELYSGDGVTSQGAMTARGQFAELKLHTYELAGYQFDPRGWLLRAIPYTDPELLHPEDLIWPVGINNFRVQYSAGFTTIPESVQEAC